MYYIISIFIGFIISTMTAMNGGLSNSYSLYPTSIIVHVLALIILTIILVIRRENVFIKEKLPFFYYIGGALGFLTLIFSNYAYPYLGVSVLLSLCLLGQSITSLVLDMFHVFNHNQKINFRTIIGIVILTVGIVVMIVM